MKSSVGSSPTLGTKDKYYMLKILSKLLNKPLFKQEEAGPTQIDEVRMSLEDRKAWRRKMVYAAIRETMTFVGVVGTSYRFKLSQIDERGHIYAVMIDVKKSFTINPLSQVKGFLGIEKLIIKNVFDKYGITVTSVYWRTVEEKVSKIIKKTVELKSVPPKLKDIDVIDDKDFGPVSAFEQEQFMQAISLGMRPKPLTIDDKEYYSDVMPFEAAKKAIEIDIDLSIPGTIANSIQYPTQPGELTSVNKK
jgi:hypothetical protein